VRTDEGTDRRRATLDRAGIDVAVGVALREPCAPAGTVQVPCVSVGCCRADGRHRPPRIGEA